MIEDYNQKVEIMRFDSALFIHYRKREKETYNDWHRIKYLLLKAGSIEILEKYIRIAKRCINTDIVD